MSTITIIDMETGLVERTIFLDKDGNVIDD